jgi:L-aminopeptidase/D-esterase-like protein
MQNSTLTAIRGIQVGHATNFVGATGCTAIICPEGTVASVDVRGGAPGTRETDLLQAYNNVQTASAIMLSGGSAFGLATADGAMRYLNEHNLGYKTQTGYNVPIVPAALLFDLMIGEQGVYPDADMGYQACEFATSEPVAEGSVGAGTGAMCGAIMGKSFATKGGLGSYAMHLPDGLIVASLMVVNAVGDVLDEHNRIMAGVRQPPEGETYMGLLNALASLAGSSRGDENVDDTHIDERQNTVIGVVATNATLTKAQAQKVAQMAHDGIARAISPAHTPFDGDTIFALATGELPAHPLHTALIGAYGAEVVTQAVRSGIREATLLDGVPSHGDIG